MTDVLEEHAGYPFDLPDMLRSAREAAGMTQRELGEACGLCQATIYRLEKGKIDPRSEQLERVLRPLGLRVMYAFVREGGEDGVAQEQDVEGDG